MDEEEGQNPRDVSQSMESDRLDIQERRQYDASIESASEITPENIRLLIAEEEQVKYIRSTSEYYQLTEEARNFDEYFNALNVDMQEYSNDLQTIIDFYVRYGVCNHTSPQIRNNEVTKMWCLSKKYALTVHGFPEDYTVSTSQVAAFAPYIVAVRLEISHPLLIGSLNGLPQCFAFPGGLHLIPKGYVTWKPLEILWKMWKVSYPDNVVRAGGSDDFMAIRYFYLASEDTACLIKDFGIVPPLASEVCCKIDGILSSYNYDTLYPSFEKVFSIYAEDIFEFYSENCTVFLSETIVIDVDGYPNAIDVYKKLYRMTSEMPDDVTVDPIYKSSKGESPPLATLTFEDVMRESGEDEYLQEKVKVLETKIARLKAIVLNRVRKARVENPHDDTILVKEHELLASLKRLSDARDEYSKKIKEKLETYPPEVLVPSCQRHLPIRKRYRCTFPQNSEETQISKLSSRLVSSKRNRSVDMESEAPELSKYWDHRILYKSKEDFTKLPSVLEIESQQECSLRESRKKYTHSQRNSKRAMLWSTVEKKLYWDYGLRWESLVSVEREMPCETQTTLTHFGSTSLEERLKEEVRQYFARNPVRVCASMSLQSRELPITEEFLRSLVGQTTRSVSDGNGAERGGRVSNTSNDILSCVPPQKIAGLVSGENGQSNRNAKKDKMEDSRQSPVSMFDSNRNLHNPEGDMPVRPQLMDEDMKVSGASATPSNIDPVEDEEMHSSSLGSEWDSENSTEMVVSPVITSPGITKQVGDENLPTRESIQGTLNTEGFSEWLLTKGATAGMEHLQGPSNLNPAFLQPVSNIGEYTIPGATEKMLIEEAIKQSIISAKKPIRTNKDTEDSGNKMRVSKPFSQIFDSTEFSIAPPSSSLEYTMNLNSNDRLLLGVIYHNFPSPPSSPRGGTTKRTAQIRKVIRARMADRDNLSAQDRE